MDDISWRATNRADTTARPQTRTEVMLGEIWCAVLKCDEVRLHDSFFDVGGKSLLVCRMTAMIKNAFNVTISFRTVLDNPTLQKLANVIDNSRTAR